MTAGETANIERISMYMQPSIPDHRPHPYAEGTYAGWMSRQIFPDNTFHTYTVMLKHTVRARNNDDAAMRAIQAAKNCSPEEIIFMPPPT